LEERLIEEVKIPVYFLDHRLQAAGANHFNPGSQLAGDPDLAFQQFRRGIHFQRFCLSDFTQAVINASRSVTLPDVHFADGKILDIKEHYFGTSCLSQESARPAEATLRPPGH